MATAIIVHLLWIKMEGGCEQIFWKRVNIRPTLAARQYKAVLPGQTVFSWQFLLCVPFGVNLSLPP